jgi:O-antigen/teichoic acid export membrane protein
VYSLTLLLLIGYGVANILNWNRPLLLALGKPSYPLLIAIAVGAIELLLIVWLVPGSGYLAMGAILSGYLAFTVCITAWVGLRMIQKHEIEELSLSESESTGNHS